MSKKQKEKATALVRLYPSTRQRAKIKAAKERKTLAAFINSIV